MFVLCIQKHSKSKIDLKCFLFFNISTHPNWCRVSPNLKKLFPLFCVVTKLYSFALIIDIGLILFNINKGIKVDIRDIELINKLLLIISSKSNLIKFKFNTI